MKGFLLMMEFAARRSFHSSMTAAHSVLFSHLQKKIKNLLVEIGWWVADMGQIHQPWAIFISPAKKSERVGFGDAELNLEL